jgi:uncharacterized protein (DUF3820 family)
MGRSAQEGKAMTDDSPKIIPFGKYKGRLVDEVLVDDPGYLQWLAGQDWFRAKFNILHQVIINRGGETQETPEHNALQVKFLDDDFCLRFVRHFEPKLDEIACTELQTFCAGERLKDLKHEALTKNRDLVRDQQSLEQHAKCDAEGKADIFRPYRSADKLRSEVLTLTAEIHDLEKRIADLLAAQKITTVEFSFALEFEHRGVDVVLQVFAASKSHNIDPYELHEFAFRRSTSRGLQIELKPTVGDDYPAVLRQMKANGSEVLLLRDYVGTGATREQFIKTFATAEKRIVFLQDVDGTGADCAPA